MNTRSYILDLVTMDWTRVVPDMALPRLAHLCGRIESGDDGTEIVVVGGR